MLRLLGALVTLLLAVPATAAAEVIPTADPGRLERFEVETAEGVADYLVYTPSTVGPDDAVPLYVMTHGCNTTALQQARANLHHPVAERERFVVLYPDLPAGTHPLRCWRFYDPGTLRREGPDPTVVATEVREVLRRRPIDAQRVYAMGMSSGGFLTSILAATHPDLFAAVGVMAAGPYGGGACILTDRVPRPTPELPVLAALAHAAMGPRARVVPVIALHGDSDAGVPPGCGEGVIEQGLRTANLVATDGARQEAPLSLVPADTRTVQDPGRRAAEVREFRDPQGCLVAEGWTIAGMGHFWSGGSAEPALAGFTDPTGPSAAEISWRFLSRYRRDETSLPCAEAPAPAPIAAACRSRRVVTFRLPSGARAVRATVGGRPAKVTRRGRTLRVDLRGRGAGPVRIRVTARTAGRRHVRSTVVRPCTRRVAAR